MSKYEVNHVTDSSTLTVLNIVVSTPENREGAVRAGLQLGDHLAAHATVDTVKMAGNYDDELAAELDLENGFHTTPARTALRDAGRALVDTDGNYENTLIWTELSTPRPLSEYDIAHLHNAVPLWGFLSASFRCRLAGVPYVVTTHGVSKIPELPESMDMTSGQRVVFRLAFLNLYKYVLRHAAHLIALSGSDKQRLLDLFPEQSVSVIPNGVAVNATEAPSRPLPVELSETKPTLLFVGKLIRSKGVGDLLDAYCRLDTDCQLILVGPPTNGDFVARVKNHESEDICYLGYVDQEILDVLYREADIFVFPTRSDVFPLVTLEAMAAGTPVVATKVGGLPEQITSDTGVLVPPREPTQFAAAVDRLLQNDTDLVSMGENAKRRVVSEYSWNEIARETLQIYEEVRSND